MSWLKTSWIAIVCLAIQPPKAPSTLAAIKAYVNQIASDGTLTPFYVNYNTQRGDALGRDTIFYAHSTDFPCSAILSYSGTRLVRVKEIVRTSSRMVVYQYYLRNNQLVFVEHKEVFCQFGHESPKTKYYEKDYLFHGKYYVAGDTCLAGQERGKSSFAGWHRLAPDKCRTHCRFFIWQAARYVALFKKN